MGISTIIGAAIGVAAGWTIGYFGSKVKTDKPC